MGVFGYGYIQRKVEIDPVQEAYDSFMNEYNNFNKLVEASEILTENGIVIVTEGAFIDKIKELWKKFIDWLKRVGTWIKDKIKDLVNKIKEFFNKAKNGDVRIKDFKLYKIKDTSSIDVNVDKIFSGIIKTFTTRDKSVKSLDDALSSNIARNKKLAEFIESNKDTIDKFNEDANKYTEEVVNKINARKEREEVDFGVVNDSNITEFWKKIDEYDDMAYNFTKSIDSIISSLADAGHNNLNKFEELLVKDLDLRDFYARYSKLDIDRGVKVTNALLSLTKYTVTNVMKAMTDQVKGSKLPDEGLRQIWQKWREDDYESTKFNSLSKEEEVK